MGRVAFFDDASSESDDHMHAGKMLDAIILTHKWEWPGATTQYSDPCRPAEADQAQRQSWVASS
jgi:hypothetical protein